jgi:hypothetical protein
MSTSALVAYNGARKVDLATLEAVPCPPPTETYFPVPHHQVFRDCKSLLEQANFRVEKYELALSRHDDRFFGTLDLSTSVATGVNLCVGIRSAQDRSIPLGLVAGHRVFVCSNMAFRADLINVRRKHTRNGQIRFHEAITMAIQNLVSFQEAEGERIGRLQNTEITQVVAESLILRAYRKEIISTQLLPRVIAEWEKPSYEEFEPRTLWSLYNAHTTILADRQKTNPQQFAHLTIRLSDLFSQVATQEEPDFAMAT